MLVKRFSVSSVDLGLSQAGVEARPSWARSIGLVLEFLGFVIAITNKIRAPPDPTLPFSSVGRLATELQLPRAIREHGLSPSPLGPTPQHSVPRRLSRPPLRFGLTCFGATKPRQVTLSPPLMLGTVRQNRTHSTRHYISAHRSPSFKYPPLRADPLVSPFRRSATLSLRILQLSQLKGGTMLMRVNNNNNQQQAMRGMHRAGRSRQRLPLRQARLCISHTRREAIRRRSEHHLL